MSCNRRIVLGVHSAPKFSTGVIHAKWDFLANGVNTKINKLASKNFCFSTFCTVGTCPEAMVPAEGTCYKIINAPVLWKQANGQCEGERGILGPLSFHSHLTLGKLPATILTNGKCYWTTEELFAVYILQHIGRSNGRRMCRAERV